MLLLRLDIDLLLQFNAAPRRYHYKHQHHQRYQKHTEAVLIGKEAGRRMKTVESDLRTAQVSELCRRRLLNYADSFYELARTSFSLAISSIYPLV